MLLLLFTSRQCQGKAMSGGVESHTSMIDFHGIKTDLITQQQHDSCNSNSSSAVAVVPPSVPRWTWSSYTLQ
eukprot:scaffold2098_cov228-Ochromonas_danica.AAC.3